MSLQIIEMKVADLVPYAMNAKQHPAEQVAQIAASIEEFGMNDPVAVWHDADGVPIIVEGHGRVLALQKLKRKTCPVICLDDLSDAQRRAYTLVHNQLTLNSGFDIDMLNSELAQIKTDLPSLDMGQFDLRINDDTPDNVYTAKIDTPVYTPQSDTPTALSALYDHSKTVDSGTYVKSFYSVIANPAAANVSVLCDYSANTPRPRFHHNCVQNHYAPKIIPSACLSV